MGVLAVFWDDEDGGDWPWVFEPSGAAPVVVVSEWIVRARRRHRR